MNYSNVKQMKNIAKNLREIKSNIKKCIKRQDILDFIEKGFKQEYVNFEVSKNICTFFQGGNGDTFHIEIYPGLGIVHISLKSKTEQEEYNIDFDCDKTIINYSFYSGWKLTSVEKTYEYHNDILVRETKEIKDGHEREKGFIEQEAIYDAPMKMLMRKRREFIINMNEPNKPNKINYESTSFIGGINIDSKKNLTENFSYFDLHIPCVEIREHSYKMATERLENTGVVKKKVKGSMHGGRSE